MQNKNIEKLIPIAMTVMEPYRNKFKKETSGYFSAFGPSVMMAGLHQTVLAYQGDDNKKTINEIILKIYNQMEWNSQNQNLNELVSTHNFLVKKRLLEVVVACKLVIGTYSMKDK